MNCDTICSTWESLFQVVKHVILQWWNSFTCRHLFTRLEREAPFIVVLVLDRFACEVANELVSFSTM